MVGTRSMTNYSKPTMQATDEVVLSKVMLSLPSSVLWPHPTSHITLFQISRFTVIQRNRPLETCCFLRFPTGSRKLRGIRDYPDDDEDEVINVFEFVKVFVIIGMILAFIFAVLAFLAGVCLTPGWISLLVGIIAAIVVIIGPVYMIFALPDAMDEEGVTFTHRTLEDDGPHKSF